MRKLITLDAYDYDADLPEVFRIAVRGIIFVNGKLLMVSNGFGEVKLPGGGQESGENDCDTLIREVLEETGYHVIAESIREYGEVEEKRLSVYESAIWHQINRYYFCDVEINTREECCYTEGEKKYDSHPVWLSLEEAIKMNELMLRKEGIQSWNQREISVLRLLNGEF